MKKIMFNDRYGLTQAVLDGRKTMTRRVIPLTDVDRHYLDTAFDWDFREMVISDRYSRYMVNEIVAVAQSYHELNKAGYVAPEWLDHTCESSAGYKNKMFVRADLMPHRIRITNIKVERLQDISHEDCLKEGISYQDGYFCGYKASAPNMAFGAMTAQQAFAALIDKVSGKGIWDSNPYVFVYEFELLKGGEQ